MAKFLTGNELNHQLEKLFETAEEQIILISPYINLHERYISVLRTKMASPKLKIVVVFGKNENDISKSMKISDFNFFKEFPYIEIYYEKRLHAKYYANENDAILTSMNLYNFSQDNNIEAGILLTGSLLGMINEDTVDIKAAEYFKRVIAQSTPLFRKTPAFESVNLGLSKRYKSSKIELDELSSFFSSKQNSVFPEVQNKKSDTRSNQYDKQTSSLPSGFCIRTGKPITFNIARPFCEQAFDSWMKYKDENYIEHFCHFSGEPSNGKTTFKKPILAQNYKKAKEIFDL